MRRLWPRNRLLRSSKEKTAEEVSPTEDLMREHGLLNRVLLIYDEIARRIDARKDYDPKVVTIFCRHHSQIHRAISREARGKLPFPAFHPEPAG